MKGLVCALRQELLLPDDQASYRTTLTCDRALGSPGVGLFRAPTVNIETQLLNLVESDGS